MPYKEIIPTNPNITDLLAQIKNYYHQEDMDMVRLAYDFAEKAHRGQFRKSGEPYIIHPVATAMILAHMRIDPNIIVAALLHDVPEDTTVTLEDIEKNFGPDIATMIRGITKLGKIKYRGVERYIENLRKMFVAMAEDIRVIIIKFADRVHNLSTIEALPQKKRFRIALESLEIYAPIANRLGIGEFKSLLEDLSFPHVLPKEYEKTKAVRETLVSEREAYLQHVMDVTRNELQISKINVANIHGREKTLYSLYRKIVTKGGWENTEQIHDVVAIRIVVENLADCYAALGIVHKLWRPLKGRIKDYISQPKPNGYKSLHTTVFCIDGQIVEFQIRDRDMHNEAEYGIAAHWHYDERGSRLPAKDIFWAKELAEIQKTILAKLSDIDELKVDFFKNRIFVFTPKGDVFDLPEDATPIDFAYTVHTDIGNQCNGAKVNDQLVSLTTPLKSGDVVEIFTDKNRKGPSQDWLKNVKTHQAKTKIKERLKTEKVSWLKNILPRKK
jgi:guanosine-3',5'-bis(diphosphate) 3'-pyrophosphohydrolase